MLVSNLKATSIGAKAFISLLMTNNEPLSSYNLHPQRSLHLVHLAQYWRTSLCPVLSPSIHLLLVAIDSRFVHSFNCMLPTVP